MTDCSNNPPRTGFVTWVIAFALLAVAVYAAVFYLRYAADAWFFQDDFIFIRSYEEHLHPEQWLSPANFGRFISRNLYWWAGWKLFGPHATGYYMFNLALMLSTSLLLLKFCLRHSLSLGLLLASAYWAAGATVGNFCWLSNSQHLLAHALMALYFCVAQRAWHKESVPLLLVSLLVYAASLSANVLSAVAISLPMAFLWLRPRGRYATFSLVTLSVQIGLALLFVITVRPESGGAYATALTLPVLFSNMAYYYGHPAVFLGLTALVCSVAWARLRSGDYIEAWLLVAGPAFILPFLPLTQQHYLSYAAFSHAFMLVGLCICASRAQVHWLRAMAWGIVALVLWELGVQTYYQISYFKHERRGEAQRELVQELNKIVRAKAVPVGSTLCFSEHGEQHVPGTPLPGFWWFVGFGDAFKQFVSSRYSYELMSDGIPCAYNFRIDGRNLSLPAR